MFLSSTTGPFLRPDLPDSTAPRTEAVKTGRRPPPQAAQCGLDGREHGATLNQVGRARFLSRHTIRKGWLTDLLPAGLPPAALFACHNGRKSHHSTHRCSGSSSTFVAARSRSRVPDAKISWPKSGLAA